MKDSNKALRKPLISQPVHGQDVPVNTDEPRVHSGNVLVVEDNPDIRSLLNIALSPVNADVELISDGAVLRDMICESLPPAVLVLDRMLPGVSGDLLLKQIRSDPQWQHTPVVMISALRRRTEVNYALKGGANHYLPKPLDLSALVSTVEGYLH